MIEYTVWLGDESTTEDDPSPTFDLRVPQRERDAIARVAEQLGLKDKNISTQDKIDLLRDFFSENFQ